MRYTEARLAPIAREMLRDLDSDTVDFGPNYDGSEREPLGPAGALPEPARQRLQRHRRRHGDEHPAAQPQGDDRRDDRLHREPGHRRPGPDAAHEGPGLPDRRRDPRALRHPRRLRDRPRPRAGARHARTSSRSAATARRSWSPSCRSWSRRAATAASSRRSSSCVNEKKLTEISDVQDHSDRNGMRIVIELKRDANPKVVLNKLYKHTPMQTTFGVNMVALVENVPKLLLAARGHPQLRPPPARGHRPPRQARAARRSSARVHRARGPADRARPPRRGDRADPRLARPRHGPHRADGALRAHRHPGPGDPRPAPAAADRASRPTRCARSTRTRWSGSASCASCSATRTWSSS